MSLRDDRWTPGSGSPPKSLLGMHRTAVLKGMVSSAAALLWSTGWETVCSGFTGIQDVRMVFWAASSQGGRSEHPWAGRAPSSRAGTVPRASGQQPCCPGKNPLASLAGRLELKADDIRGDGLLSSFERITEPSTLFLHVHDGEDP